MNILNKIIYRKNQILVYPNNLGAYLNGMIFLLLLLASGYTNNLILIFSLLLMSLNFLWIIQSYIKVKSDKTHECISTEDFYSGEPIHFLFENLLCDKISFLTDKGEINFSKKSATKISEFGIYHVKKMRLFYTEGLGFYRFQKIINSDFKVYVYPRRDQDTGRNVLDPVKDGKTDKQSNHEVSDEVHFHKPIQTIERASRVDWKAYSRKQDLLEKTAYQEEGSSHILNLDRINLYDSKVLEQISFLLNHFEISHQSWSVLLNNKHYESKKNASYKNKILSLVLEKYENRI